MPTPVSGAFISLWILPRTKKVSTGHFFTLPAVGPSFRILCCSANKNSRPKAAFLLAEQQGFEPWQHFHALRDFESRLFDQLEYCSVFWTCLLYQFADKKSRIVFALCQVDHCAHFFHDTLEVFSSVGDQAIRAVLNSLFCISKIAATPVSQGIQRAITKQAAEAFCVLAFMAGKIFASGILKELVVCHSLTPLI